MPFLFFVLRRFSVVLLLLVQTIAVFLQLIWQNFLNIFYKPTPAVEVLIDVCEFENCFKDSGYWDYFLLILFDTAFRVYWVYSLIFISDFSIVEKSSWLILSGVLSGITPFMTLELRSITEILFLAITVSLLILFFILFLSSIAVLL